jgi:hypothetical protein
VYGEPPYGQSPYGGTGYGQHAYAQPGYTQQPGYGADYVQQPPAKKSKKGLWISLLALVVIVGVLGLISVVAKVPSSLYPKDLSHSAVERYIEGSSQLGNPTDVRCNGGKNFRLKNNGDSFTCTATGGRSFKVTITNKDKGNYVVQ